MRISDQAIHRIYIEQDTREPDFVMPTHHYHPYFELYYVNKGSCRFFISNEFHDLMEGDVMLIPLQELHYTRYQYGTCTRTAIYYRKEDLLPNGMDQLTDFDTLSQSFHILHVPENRQAEIEGILRHMLLDERAGDRTTKPALQIHLQELFLMLLRHAQETTHSPAVIHTGDAQILKAAQYISQHYAEPLTSADIARETGFSTNYFSSRFKEMTGIGVHEYLVFTRLRHAARLLSTTDRQIGEIALACGFESGNYFKDAFRKMYGMTPREYRAIL